MIVVAMMYIIAKRHIKTKGIPKTLCGKRRCTTTSAGGSTWTHCNLHDGMGYDVLLGETMTTTKQSKDLEQHKHEALNALIGEQLLQTLGNPDQLLKVQVKPLWGNHYRVNVCVGADAAVAKVAHSYFMEADGDGKITSSTPTITKQY